jgi:hypothetical protein
VSTDPSNVRNPSIEGFGGSNTMKSQLFLALGEILQSFNPRTHTDTSTAGKEWPGDLYERLKD